MSSDSLMSQLESIKSMMAEHNSFTSHWHMTKPTLNYELLTLLNESMFFQLKKKLYILDVDLWKLSNPC